MFARTRKPAPTTTVIRPLTKARVEYALTLGALKRDADHAIGGHTARPVIGCPACG